MSESCSGRPSGEIRGKRRRLLSCPFDYPTAWTALQDLFVGRRRLYHRRSHAEVRSSSPPQAGERNEPTRRGDSRSLLARILDTPHLAQSSLDFHPRSSTASFKPAASRTAAISSRWPHPISCSVSSISICGAAQPGLDEHLDADRFGVWLDVLMEAGATVAARKVAGMNVDLVIAALAEHVLVVDRAAVSPYDDDGRRGASSRRIGRRARLRGRRLCGRGKAHAARGTRSSLCCWLSRRSIPTTFTV